MTAPVAQYTPHQNLTADQAVTLRRVAFGQSEVRSLRRQDLDALRDLKLIADHRDGPLLTAAGRKVFDALPRPSAQAGPEPMEKMLAELARVTSPDRR